MTVRFRAVGAAATLALASAGADARTVKPVLHGQHWVAITGKPLAVTAGAAINVIEPGKRPRATLTPTLALKNGQPYLAFAVQGGDTQDQNLLQVFLNVVEFGMTVQEAGEAANITSYQMRDSFGMHESQPGRLTLNESMSPWVREELKRMGYTLDFAERTSGPITALWFDREHGTMWGGASHHGDDYGIAW